MKVLKQWTIITLFFVCFSQGYSQISIGGQLSYLKLLGGSEVSNIGIGIKGDYGFNDRTVFTGGFNYYIANKTSTTTFANAFDFATVPQTIEVESENKITFIHIYFGGKRYFVGDYEDDFNVYGIAEAGILLAPISTTIVGEYDESLYFVNEDESSETLSNFTLNFGIGAETDLDFGYLFADLKINIPANNANGQTVAVEIPTSVSFNVGVRIPLDL